MTQSILETFRQSGDANLGQTLLRLAKLAQARHQFEEADSLLRSVRKDTFPAHGSGRVAQADGMPLGDGHAAHMEVDR